MMPSLSDPLEHVAVAREVDQIAGGGEHLFGALGDFHADIGERDLVRAALDQLDADLALQLAHLHGQRRLRDRAILCGPAEMPVVSERGQITQLAQSDHADKLDLSTVPNQYD